MYNNKPIIAVVFRHNVNEDLYYIKAQCTACLNGAVVLPIMPTADRDTIDYLYSLADGVFVLGGQDVNPVFYGEENLFCGELCYSRDVAEPYIIKKAYLDNKPLLSICRGMQITNVTLGGTLYQDNIKCGITAENHRMEEPYDRMVHSVTLCKNTPIYDLIGKEKIEVNSIHHQSVKALSEKLTPMAYSRDGLLEAFYAADKKFFWGIQWHPELSYNVDSHSRIIFTKFIQAIKDGQNI